MRSNRNHDLGRTATSLLASVYVVTVGFFACLLIALLFGENPLRLILICAGSAIGVGILLWIVRDRRPNTSRITNVLWVARRPEASQRVRYRPERRRQSSASDHASHEPPTVERIRELSDNVKTWVPSRRRAENHRRSGSTGR